MPRQEIERFAISHLQVLDEEGRADPALDPGLKDAELLALYRAMARARGIDQRMLKLQRQGRIGTFGPCTGQEAASIGPAFAMGENDWLVTAFRELGARLWRGEPPINALLFHNGYEEGNVLPAATGAGGAADGGDAAPDRGRMLPISIIVAAQALHAAGVAYALKYRGVKNGAAVAFCGDGATSQGDFYEALNFAGVWKAPVLFVIQNNQWAISLPRSKQTAAATLAQKAIAAGIPGIQVDGNDILAMVAASREALDRAHRGEGPTLIEAVTYRLMMHTTADDPKKYRTEAEEQAAWKRDPIPRFRAYLEHRGLWDEARETALLAELKLEEDAVVKAFEEPRDFRPDLLFDHVFGTRHATIEAQRAMFLANREIDGAAHP
jgi:pyruvate dehydrogenase E1 component alpha subunit